MGDPLSWHRFQFAFTIIYHYLFPQLTMGLATLIVVMKGLSLRPGGEQWAVLSRFWVRLFGLNFAVGVVTGVPMEFQFGTNWARFTQVAGGVVGQTLGMESLFAFFLESSFLAMLVWGEAKLGPRKHALAAVALWVGSWLSGFFIVTTNAFMQHPVAFEREASGVLHVAGIGALLTNPWAWAQFAHNQLAALVTGCFVVTAVGAFWVLRGREVDQPSARLSLLLGTRVGLLATVLVAFPTGDHQAKLVAEFQPAALAAMEGHFESHPRAAIHLIGQPNVAERRIDNPIAVPAVLSFLAFGDFSADVKGLNDIPAEEWPTNVELLYYAFHVMVGLGTLFIGVMGLAVLLSWLKRLERTRAMLWVLMLAFPFPYIANTAGWMTAELGRQPWLIYGVLRTADGSSTTVHAGSTIFTVLGFCGLYTALGLAFAFLFGREVSHGASAEVAHG